MLEDPALRTRVDMVSFCYDFLEASFFRFFRTRGGVSSTS